MPEPKVRISSRGNRGRVDPRTVRRRGEKILIALGRGADELSIVLSDDTFIRELNNNYRDRDAPTDVLSFSMREGELSPHPELLGDVVISVETAAEQADDVGRTVLEEVTSLLIHGVLHLAGHSHDQTQAADLMFAEARRIESVILK